MMQSGVRYCTSTITTRYANMVTSDKLTLRQNGFVRVSAPVEMVQYFSLVFTALFGDFLQVQSNSVLTSELFVSL
jgi:hypothetical protein